MGSAKSGRGYMGQATKLHSLLVIETSRVCNSCGKQAPENDCGHLVVRKNCECCQSRRKRNTFQCAHIVSRSYSRTRTRLDNAFCLCGGCHLKYGKWPVKFTRFIFDAIGEEVYDSLEAAAESKKSGKMDWAAEFERLDKIAEQYGIEHEFGFKSKSKEQEESGDGKEESLEEGYGFEEDYEFEEESF